MNKLNVARFARLNRWLQWQNKHDGIFVRFPQDLLSLHTLFFVHRNICFKHMIAGMNLQQSGVTYPDTINKQSNLYQFLSDQSTPLAVQITLRNGTKRFLRNKACDVDRKIIKSCIENPKSIYGYLTNYLGPQIKKDLFYTKKVNYFLNQFYLRLTAQTYCKTNNLKSNTLLTDSTKNEILNFIGEQYQNHSPAAIKKVMSQKDIMLLKIQQTKNQIDAIQKQCDTKISFYKVGAAFVTFGHIVSFGYMIFFVDWLGWDIIQPLTYSVGVLYTMLGIRFYRKYRTDRTGDNIRQILLRIVMKPQVLVALKDLQQRLKVQQLQLKRVQIRLRLLKNRVNFTSSLADSYYKKQ